MNSERKKRCTCREADDGVALGEVDVKVGHDGMHGIISLDMQLPLGSKTNIVWFHFHDIDSLY